MNSAAKKIRSKAKPVQDHTIHAPAEHALLERTKTTLE
tara:strand:+ start:12893 stop:13006 length:114 start_codon:yes stop_codon:yes gene_type:complete